MLLWANQKQKIGIGHLISTVSAVALSSQKASFDFYRDNVRFCKSDLYDWFLIKFLILHEEPNVITADDFHINENKVVFKQDEYPLSKIKGVRLKINSLKDHAIRIVTISLIVSSVVWTICPEYFGLFTAPIALIIGVLLALSTQSENMSSKLNFNTLMILGCSGSQWQKRINPTLKLFLNSRSFRSWKKSHNKNLIWDGFQPPHKSKLCSFCSLVVLRWIRVLSGVGCKSRVVYGSFPVKWLPTT